MKVCVLASGSSGNSTYVESGDTRILIDAGLSAREIDRRLQSVGVDASCLTAIVISHEHSDHTRGVGVLARRYGLALWGNEPTLVEVEPLLKGKERVDDFTNGDVFFIYN